MAPFIKSEIIWYNGAFVPWDDARVHVLAHGLHYGTGVFEGIRCYETPDGPAVFRLQDHFTRMFESAAMYELEMPYTHEALVEATLDLIRRNRLTQAYIQFYCLMHSIAGIVIFYGIGFGWYGHVSLTIALAGCAAFGRTRLVTATGRSPAGCRTRGRRWAGWGRCPTRRTRATAAR
jgi:hypothetical protein